MIPALAVALVGFGPYGHHRHDPAADKNSTEHKRGGI
jgi:hypothetical protein